MDSASSDCDRSESDPEKWHNCISLLTHYEVDPRDSLVCDGGTSHNDEDEEQQPVWNNCFSQVFAMDNSDDEIYPLTIREIVEAQKEDSEYKQYFKNPKEDIRPVFIDDKLVLVYTPKNAPGVKRLVIPKRLQSRALQWYHHYLQHPGANRLEETLAQVFYWPGMRYQARKVAKKCKRCQKGKTRKRKYGHVPAKIAETTPWKGVCVDLIGPYTLIGQDGSKVDFMCLTIIDPATGWFEVVELPCVERITQRNGKQEIEVILDKASATVAQLFNSTWLCRYPRPLYIVYDQGSEFKLHFTELCDSYQLKRQPTSVKNPQANAIIERIHAVFGDMMRCSNLDNAPTIEPSMVAEFIMNAAWAIRSTYHTVLKSSPGAAIFGRDMLFDIPYVADWVEIGRRRQERVDNDNARENSRRLSFDYEVGQKVLLRKDGILRKAEDKYEGPYIITQVFCNGTVRIQRGSVNMKDSTSEDWSPFPSK